MGKGPQTFFKVILPQVWPLILPALANVAVSTFKLTAILGILAIDDLMKVANRINNIVFRPIEIYSSVALIYLLCGLLLTALATYIEQRYGTGRLEQQAARRPKKPAEI